MSDQLGLFESDPALPPGFRYQEEVITAAAEQELLRQIQTLPFREFEFHGYTGKRRVVSYGWQYDFKKARLNRADDMPAFLLALRDEAAGFAGLDATELQHVLITEYSAGAGIGWHRDKAVFGDVVGLSLLSPCSFRLRLKRAGGWQRASVTAQPRSAYLLRGAARTEWEHSIPGVPALRYSITYRNLRTDA